MPRSGILFLPLLVAGISFAQTTPLSFRPIGAEYSNAMDRIIMISASPDQLHIYDPVSQSDTKVNLLQAGVAGLSVSPDGLHAAVLYYGRVLYVNLVTGTVEKTFTYAGIISALAAGQDWIYGVNANAEIQSSSINISTGIVTSRALAWGTSMRIHPSGKSIYGARTYLGDGLEKYDVSAGAVASQTDSSQAGTFSVCGSVWFSPDGSRIYTGCGTVFRHSDDPTADMTYVTSLAGLPLVSGLAESALVKKVVAIAGADTNTPAKDGELTVMDSASMKPLGKLVLSPFATTLKSYPAHAKWVFFDAAGAAALVVKQADSSSSLLLDFAVERYPMTSQALCSASFDAKTATAIASGSYATAGIVAASDCIFQAVSNDSWIQLVSGSYGSGNGTLTYITRPNPGTVSRTGSISLSGQNLTITQSAGSATPSATNRIAYKVVDAKYDKALDKIVMVSANHDELHLYDPVTAQEQFVPLPAPPLAVSVQPDGLYAAVGHDGSVSYVNLKTPTVEKVIPVSALAQDVVLAGNGWIYATPNISVALSTGTAVSNPGLGSPSLLRLHPSGNFLYAGTGKWDISKGAAALASNGTINYCGNLWMSEDGLRIFTGCGQVYRSSDPTQDLQLNGILSAQGACAGRRIPWRRSPSPSFRVELML